MAVRRLKRAERGLADRPRTLKTRQLVAEERREAEPLFDWALAHGKWGAPEEPPKRPLTRGECVDGPRPCPWVSCRHHLFLDVKEGGYLRKNFPGRELEDLRATCSLDVADQGKHTLEEVGDLVNLARRAVLTIEQQARAQLKPVLEEDEDERVHLPVLREASA